MINRPLAATISLSCSIAAAHLSGCADPDGPGVEKPPIARVLSGEISTRGDYLDAVEERNRLNATRAQEGDWRHAKPAVGPD